MRRMGRPATDETRRGALAVGRTLVVRSDGPDVLAWTADQLVPQWTWRAGDRVADIAVGEDCVWVLDARGSLTSLEAKDGGKIWSMPLDSSGKRVLALRDGVVVLCMGGLRVIRQRHVVGRVDLAGIVDVAANPDGLVALATSQQTVALLDAYALTSPRQLAIGTVPTAIHWSVRGFWWVSTAKGLFPVSENMDQLSAPTSLGTEHALREAIGLHGAAAIIQTSPRSFQLKGIDDSALLGEVTIGKEVEALAASLDEVFLGLPNGQLQSIGLLSDTRRAAQSHPGRAARPWAVDDGIDRARTRGALARIRVGGGTISKHNRRTPGRSWWRMAAWGAAAVFSVLLLGAVAAWAMGWF